VTRRSRLDETLEPDQALSVEDTLRAYTQGVRSLSASQTM
jgi:predicted amidohydrolase YtcJ